MEAQAIAAVPYDVVTADEARAIIAKNSKSFLRVSRPDAELSDIPADDPRIYDRARENFSALMNGGQMLRESLRSWFVSRGKDEKTAFTICRSISYVLVLLIVIPLIMPYLL